MTLTAVSADSHITEPGDCYLPFIDPAYRDRLNDLAEIQEFFKTVVFGSLGKLPPDVAQVVDERGVRGGGLPDVFWERCVHAGDKRAPHRAHSLARRIRCAECGTGADDRSCMGGVLSQAGRRRGHALARRARVWHAPEPLHRFGKDRTAAGLHGSGDERL